MQTLTEIKSIALANASRSDVRLLQSFVDPSSCSQLPSILWLWYDQDNEAGYTLFENSALLKLKPYDEKVIWSVSGKIKPKHEVIEFENMLSLNKIKKLRIVPGNFAKTVDRLDIPFNLREDKESLFDYIFDIDEQIKCEGQKFKDMRWHVRNFFRIYGRHTTIRIHDSQSELSKRSVKHLLHNWIEHGTDGSNKPEATEYALDKFFDERSSNYFGKLQIIELRYKSSLVGFSVNEFLDNGFAVNHFQNANLNLSSISYYLFFACCELLQRKEVKYLNYQEDCDIPGLKQFKLKLRPSEISPNYLLSF